jgi:2-iminobutanoate/2-iminopropanoate deaminase
MPAREAIHTDSAPAAAGPYSQAIRAGTLVFTAGQLGIDPTSGDLVEGGVGPQAERALENLRAVLEAADSGMDQLIKVTVFLVDIEDWPAVNEVYARLVPQPFPARSAFAVRALPKDALVEIEAVAAVRPG